MGYAGFKPFFSRPCPRALRYALLFCGRGIRRMEKGLFALIHLRAILLAIRPSGSFCLKIWNRARSPGDRSSRGSDRAGPHFEAMNLLHFGKNDDPSHPTNLRLHSRDVAGEARGIPLHPRERRWERRRRSRANALVFLDIISGVVAVNAGVALGPCAPSIAHRRPIRHALTKAKRIGQPTARARTKFGSLVCGATRSRNRKTATAASQTKSRGRLIPEERRLNSGWSLRCSWQGFSIRRRQSASFALGQPLIKFRYGSSSPILREHKEASASTGAIVTIRKRPAISR